MKRTKVLSILMLMSVFAFGLMSFSSRFVDYHCFKYNGTRPLTDALVVDRTQYTEQSTNTNLSCETPIEVWCGFCIDEDSPHWDANAGTAGEPKWTNNSFKNLLQTGSPTEIYEDLSLNGDDIIGGATPIGVRAYFEEDPQD